ncbi:hypothetical protein PSEUDO8BK_10390 [Pseudomonas sp. 8BK]|nr:hypothetical protein PSEUDO8BK_10390 [Pseudomonas sp. 8BK]
MPGRTAADGYCRHSDQPTPACAGECAETPPDSPLGSAHQPHHRRYRPRPGHSCARRPGAHNPPRQQHLAESASVLATACRSCIGPLAQQVVINPGQTGQFGALRHLKGQRLYCPIQLQQQAALGVIAHQALNPEERRIARATGYRVDAVQAAAGIQHQMPGRQLDAVTAVAVLDHQLTTVVLIRITEEQGGRQVAAHPMRRARHAENRVIDMVTVGATIAVAVEARWQHLQRQGGRDELRVVAQALHDKVADLHYQRVILRQLLVGLSLERLVTCCQPAILPAGLFEGLTAFSDLLGRQHIGNVQHHDSLSSPAASSARHQTTANDSK